MVVVAAVLFGVVHGGIGMLQQFSALFPVVREEGDAYAGGDLQFMAVYEAGPCDGFQQLFRDAGNIVHFFYVGQHQYELVAAQAAHGVAAAAGAGDAAGHILQQLVASDMA